jgi:hypothetical protein
MSKHDLKYLVLALAVIIGLTLGQFDFTYSRAIGWIVFLAGLIIFRNLKQAEPKNPTDPD